MFDSFENKFNFSSSQNPEMLPAKRDKPGDGKMKDQKLFNDFLLKNAERIVYREEYYRSAHCEIKQTSITIIMKRTPDTRISPFDANGDEIVIDAEAKNVRDISNSKDQNGRCKKQRQIKEVKANPLGHAPDKKRPELPHKKQPENPDSPG